MTEKIRIGALISGGGTNLQAIINACEAGTIDGEMVFVGTDNPDAKGLQRAKKHRINSFVVDYADIISGYKQNPDQKALPDDFDMDTIMKQQHLLTGEANKETARFFFATRAIAEKGLIKEMAAYPFDLLVLAGFMRNLTPYFIDHINKGCEVPRVMNIHPALLPAFPGVDGYGDTFRYGCKVGGCTVHFIDYGEDSGPIIGQRSFYITEEDTLDTIKEKGLRIEWELYAHCIQLFAQKRLWLEPPARDQGKSGRTKVRILPGPDR